MCVCVNLTRDIVMPWRINSDFVWKIVTQYDVNVLLSIPEASVACYEVEGGRGVKIIPCVCVCVYVCVRVFVKCVCVRIIYMYINICLYVRVCACASTKKQKHHNLYNELFTLPHSAC